MSKKKHYKNFETSWRGYNVVCTPVGRQEYSNCYIESGKVTGHPTDTMYLKVSGDEIETATLLLRPDEAEAIIWVLSGTLWCQEMDKI